MEGGILSRLVVVSNRVAVATDNKAQTGGLAVALQDALREHGGIWFGWSGKTKTGRTQNKPTMIEAGNVTFATLDLSRRRFNEYYNGYANRTLWPLFHYRLDLTAFEKQNYAGYREVNTIFAEKLRPLLKRNDLIWVHDYHLIPFAEELRNIGVKQPIGFFLHIPFPAMEVLTVLPDHRNLVRALCAYDLLGFQTENDLRAFLDYIVHEANGSILGDHLIEAYGRIVRVEIFPIGIDTEDMMKAGMHQSRSRQANKLLERTEERDWIIGVDRLDYSKGLVQRFRALEKLFANYPGYRNKVSLLQIAPPTRSEVPEYKEIRYTLEAESGRINGRFADLNWVPINYLNKSFKRQDLAVLYRSSRIGLITPLRDGMNLVAKEYVAAQNPHDPGVLVLSRFAGAANELSSALIVNPFDLDSVAEAIAKGLEMPLEERRERWSAMMVVLRHNTLSHWRDAFIETLSQAPFKG